MNVLPPMLSRAREGTSPLLLAAKLFKLTLGDLMHLEVVSRQPGDFACVCQSRDRALVHSDGFRFSISFSTSLVIVFNSWVGV
jgi:hypothetical protein